MHHRTVYPFHKMAVGQSFTVSAADDPRGNKVRSAAYAYASRHEGYRFQVGPSAREEDGGYLVLRVECRPEREKREPHQPVASAVAAAPAAPLPPHTVMIDGVLAPDPARPWVGKRFEEFTVDDRRAIVEMFKHVEWETLTDDEADVMMEGAPGAEVTPSEVAP